jgi:hypothetical protein
MHCRSMLLEYQLTHWYRRVSHVETFVIEAFIRHKSNEHQLLC